MKIITKSLLGLMALAMASPSYAGGKQKQSSEKRSTTSEQAANMTIDRNVIQQGQEALNDELAVALQEDGLLGPSTRAAIRQFQVEQGLAVTSEFDTPTLQALGIWPEEDMTMDRFPASVPSTINPMTTDPEKIPEVH